MMDVLVPFTIEDITKWKPVFEEAVPLRKNFGIKGVRVFSRAQTPMRL